MSSILLFDSGVGGLSILEHVREAFPQWPVHYLADNARFPYGELEEENLIHGCVHLITTLVRELTPAMVVVACNTASTLALPALRSALPIPVIGVVPAIKPAAALSHTGTIALLATPGTVRRSYTDGLIQDFAPHCRVIRLGSSDLVRMAEEKLSGKAVDTSQLHKVLAPLLAEAELDAVVLGCTHFPLLRDEIGQVLGPKVRLVDSGSAIARRVGTLVNESRVLPGKQQGGYYCTGQVPSAALAGYLEGCGLVFSTRIAAS
ncbi:glutamate racemase [Ferrimonas sediminicola]|uniref:Glutamate racemase n=2 Tax=Ferrimonas sediminicola TaxID=2569538 RepID=A0A4U1BAE1_9GAMM|nr:glutamate racemase [Ferrimonas sediminicola]TKB47656.1 glutamate racemase [Ferrimonas sediminicola]